MFPISAAPFPARPASGSRKWSLLLLSGRGHLPRVLSGNGPGTAPSLPCARLLGKGQVAARG